MIPARTPLPLPRLAPFSLRIHVFDVNPENFVKSTTVQDCQSEKRIIMCKIWFGKFQQMTLRLSWRNIQMDLLWVGSAVMDLLLSWPCVALLCLGALSFHVITGKLIAGGVYRSKAQGPLEVRSARQMLVCDRGMAGCGGHRPICSGGGSHGI